MGDANGSIPTVQPIIGRRMWGAEPAAAALNSVVWVSQISVELGIKEKYGLKKRTEPVRNTRKIGKGDMKHNDSMPKMSGEHAKSATVAAERTAETSCS